MPSLIARILLAVNGDSRLEPSAPCGKQARQIISERRMARMQVSEIPKGTSSPDGTKITVEIKLVSGVTHTLVVAYRQLETLTNALLQLAQQAYDRQVAAGILPQLVEIGRASCRERV